MNKFSTTVKRFSMRATLLCAALVAVSCGIKAQEKPQLKVDFGINRNKLGVTLEPGFTEWFGAEGKQASKTLGGVKVTLSVPEGAAYTLHSDWNKTYLQAAEYAEKNGRLTFDGLTLAPKDGGTIRLSIEGLPAGRHTLQTYHNCWGNPADIDVAPFIVKVNGRVVHEGVKPSFLKAVAANACLLYTEFEVKNAGDATVIEFSTRVKEAAAAAKDKKRVFASPLINGFELNTPNIAKLAKNPVPANNDTHFDGDNKTVTLKWESAKAGVKQHRLFIATSKEELEAMTNPVAVYGAATTSHTLSDVYSLNTYYWRVDEVDAEGNISRGDTWRFKTRQLAFPGAEGYGRFAQGGRGGTVYHVTNLSSERIPGSFLYGLKDIEGPRTIVFDVSGVIDLGMQGGFTPSYVTIAGQTAPGKGVCIKGSNLSISSDNICRFMRFKRGYGPTGNAMGMAGANHAIVDHTTTAWGTDETVSGRGAKNITFQYSTIFEALGIADHKNYREGTNHGYAATIDGKIGSWHHNLLANCYGRNWSMGGGMDGDNRAIGQMDIFNNVVYNWGARTTDGNCHEVNFVGNYYKMGPDTKRKQLLIQQYENIGHKSSTWQAYVSGNIRENIDGTLTQDAKGDTYDVQLSNGAKMPAYPTVVDKPFFPSYAVIHSATDAFKIVTSEAGATMPMRDDHHLRIVNETVNGTYTYTGSRSGIRGEIDHEADCGGFEDYPETHRAADYDTDLDGMPDWYEKLTGSDPATADNNLDPDRDGWTLLEDYLEFMANPYIIIKAGDKGMIDAAQFFSGFTKKPVYTIEGGSPLFKISASGSKIKVKAGKTPGITKVTMRVTDAEGSTYAKRLSIAITEK